MFSQLPFPGMWVLAGSGACGWMFWHRLVAHLCRQGWEGSAGYWAVLVGLEPWDPVLGLHQGGRPPLTSGTLTLWPWAPHLGPPSFSSWVGRAHVAEMCGLGASVLLEAALRHCPAIPYITEIS